jgi:dihydroneopterin aldolase / 2-amino-4-hydroxy-6-hydroxymethyldihydropteridine diphosphokinase
VTGPNPPVDPQGRPWDVITLTGLTAHGRHGVLEAEHLIGQFFSVDVAMYLDARSAAAIDDLARTVSYAEVAEVVHRMISGEPVDLIETLAHRIAVATLALDSANLMVVDVTVHKPHAPIPVVFSDVSVTVRRFRDELLEEKPE